MGEVVQLQMTRVPTWARLGLALAALVAAWVVYLLAVFEPYATAEIENCPDRKLYELMLKEKGIPIQMLTPTRFEFRGAEARRIKELMEAFEERQKATPPADMPKCP
jgi:hypothetical protein